MDVEEAAEELYALAPAEFTARRAQVAGQVRRDGQPDVAKEIAELRRPTVSAGLINRLVRAEDRPLERLRSLGVELRQAQAKLDGPQLRELTRQRHETVAVLVRRASELAADSGQKVSGSVQRELEETFGAAAADEQASFAVTSGRLTRALVYAGFGEVDVSAATATPLTKAPRPVQPKSSPASPETPTSPAPTSPAGSTSAAAPSSATAPSSPRSARAEGDARARAQAKSDAEEERARKAADSAREAAESARNAAESAQRALAAAEDELATAAQHRQEMQAREAELSDRLAELQRAVLQTRHELDSAARQAVAADRDHQRQERQVREAQKSARQAAAQAERTAAGLTPDT